VFILPRVGGYWSFCRLIPDAISIEGIAGWVEDKFRWQQVYPQLIQSKIKTVGDIRKLGARRLMDECPDMSSFEAQWLIDTIDGWIAFPPHEGLPKPNERKARS